MRLLAAKDLFLFPIYAALVILIASLINSRINKNNKINQKYFMQGVYLRLLATIAFSLVHAFVYGGDTSNYFTHGSKHIWNAFLDSPVIGLKILLQNNNYIDGQTLPYTSRMYLWHGDSSAFIIKLSAVVGLFTFHSYTLIALAFSLFAFSGLWSIYKVFYTFYPNLHKYFAISILFIPTVVFWSSGLLKDPITLGAVGWYFYAFYFGLVRRENVLKNIIIIIICSYLIISIKLYILMCLLPATLAWLFIEYNSKIRNSAFKLFSKPLFFFFGVIAAYFSADFISSENKRYSLENLSKTAATSANYIYRMGVQKEGSAYHLGELDGSMQSLIKIAPQAINVALFRPYLWEAKNPFMLLSALESLIVLIFTIYVLLSTGIFKSFTLIGKTPILLFSVIFSLVFAFAVGATSYNFGSLVRYKIPLLPFFISALFIIRNYKKTLSNSRQG